MLNASAKEFVPTKEARCVSAQGASAKEAGLSSSGVAIHLDCESSKNNSGCGKQHQQLSANAPAFVPRSTVSSNGLPNGATPEAPRSDLTHRTDSTVSSSFISRNSPPECDWAYGEEQPESSAMMSSPLLWADSTCAVPGSEELSSEQPNSYDMYGYGMYDGYVPTLPYAPVGDCVADDGSLMAATVYYDAPYDPAYSASYQDAYQQHCYWDPAAADCAYMYGGYVDEYGNTWSSEETYAHTSPQYQQPYPSPAPTALAYVSPVAPAPQFSNAAVADEVADLDLDLDCLGSVRHSLPPAEAAELLELFFPSYAGSALVRLLERTGGDLVAAFSELAAMERQVSAERAAAGSRGPSGGTAGRQPGVKSQAGRRQAGFKLDMEAFPTLPASSPKPSSTQPAPSGQAANSDASSETAPPASGDAAPTTAGSDIPSNVDQSLPAATSPPAAASPCPSLPAPVCNSPPKANYAALLRPSSASPANEVPSEVSQSESSSEPAAPAQTGAECSARPDLRAPRRVNNAAARTAKGPGGALGGKGRWGGEHVPRVATGETAAAQYAEERAEASMLARARNQYFQQATLAYMAGNKALAKQLGRKGREANEAMKAAHAAAAARIFTQRNAANGGSSTRYRGKGSGSAEAQANAGPAPAASPTSGAAAADGVPLESFFVDLHGLHVAEAVAYLEKQIEAARSAGYRWLYVCTGTGSHTRGSRTPARLPSAVADTLLAHHLTFKTLKPGLLQARL